MPSVVTEFVQSRTTTIGSSPQHEKIFIVRGTDDESTALTAAWNTAANSFGGSGVFPYLTKKNATVEPTSVIEGNANACIWTASITYLRPQAGSGGGASETRTFDTGGGTKHLTQSLGTVAANSIPAANGVKNYDGAIGARENQGVLEIEGVDVVSPVFNFTETKYIPDANVTANYSLTLAELTGSVNNAAFKGFAAGEVLFLGVSGSKRDSDSKWEMTFKFSAQRNRPTVAVGSEMSFANVAGWNYLWIEYSNFASANGMIRKPVRAYVEKVYPDKDFSLLEIGT